MCSTNSRAILVLSLIVGLLVVGTLPERAGAVEPPVESGEPAIFVPKAAEGAREPSRRWEVHLVHGSHHDLGYTDLPSNVLHEHDGHLDKVLDFCDETADWPEESRFRYVAEQAWSVLHYLEHRPAEKTRRLLRLMREGRIEVTATLGNQVCGLCSHEELIRLLYPSFRLKRRFGVPIMSAELNDIPGFSWGLASVLSGLVVRSPESGEVFAAEHSRITMGERGPVMASLVLRGDGKGCAQRVQEITLYEGLKRIDFATRLLKDAQPLLELYLAFPFALEGAEWRFEGAGAVLEPIRDQWPGSNTDTYVVQHWVSARDRRGGVTLSSLEAPLVKLGGLWPDSTSQASHGATAPDYGRAFLRDPKDMSKGHVYSYAMAINFRTNFATVQAGDVLFRYSMTTHAGGWQQGNSREFGYAAASPLVAVPIKGPQQGPLPESDGFCRIDKPNVMLLALKVAEDGNGLVLRLAETEGAPAVASVTLPHYDVRAARAANLVEEQQGELEHDGHTVKVPVRTHGTATVRLTGGSN